MLAALAAVYAPVITDNPEFETPAPGLDKIVSQATPLTGFSVRSPLPGLGLSLSLRRIGSRSTITGWQGVLYMAKVSPTNCADDTIIAKQSLVDGRLIPHGHIRMLVSRYQVCAMLSFSCIV
jgi:hypothetical protein